jgi:hypothetical protein
VRARRWRGSRWCGGLAGLVNGAAVWEKGSNAVAVPLLWSPPARGGGSRGNGEREWRGLRWRPQLHARAHACDVEATAGRECHAATELCPSATTRRRR